MLYGLILVVHTFVCFVLIAVILLQAGRGGGLTDSFGGGNSSIFGTRGAVYLTRATTACAAIFMLTSLTLAVLSAQRGKSLMEKVPTVQTTPPATTETTEPKPTEESEPAVEPTPSEEPTPAPSESSEP